MRSLLLHSFARSAAKRMIMKEPAPEKQRIIIHIDCNAFYASVEEVFHPELKNVPMAICGDPDSRRGIILAKNQLAKGYGIKTAETIWQAKQKCPSLILKPAKHHIYQEYCEKINAIYEEYTDQVERFSIDESYLDVTSSLHLFGGNATALAHHLRKRVARETGITVSVGVSFNKIFAKLASDLKKPNAVTVISPDQYKDIVWPLPVRALLMVGQTTEKALEGMRIRTIGDLALSDPVLLKKHLGKMGGLLHIYANGLDSSPVRRSGESSPPQSIGNATTFKRDLISIKDIQTALTALADKVSSRLRKHGMKCQTLQITIKDTRLKVITRQKSMPYPLWLASDIAKESCRLFLLPGISARPSACLQSPGKTLYPQKKQKSSFLFSFRTHN